MQKTFQVKVFGKVQGVWYRASTKNKAQELGLNGFVLNQEDGCVFIEVSGEAEKINALLEWCKEGPTHAKVEKLEVKEIDFRELPIFEVRR